MASVQDHAWLAHAARFDLNFLYGKLDTVQIDHEYEQLSRIRTPRPYTSGLEIKIKGHTAPRFWL